MATRPETLEPILDAIPGATARKMFGEYAVYFGGRVVALVCDDTLFFKALPEVAALLPGAQEGPPYPGAKPHLIADPWIDDPEVLAEVAQLLARLLPEPKPKKRKGTTG
jgi:DNA transformation protein